MDQDKNPPVNDADAPRRISRRRALIYGASGVAGLSAGGVALSCFWPGAAKYVAEKVESSVEYVAEKVESALESVASTEIFENDAPNAELWERWKRRGWVKEARHCLTLGENIQCKLCPNECLLSPEDRSRCRNRVHKEGKLYTMAYGNPCAWHIDPIEKKPLFHFEPRSRAFSIATSGCGFRCLNCQNWDISQRKPEERKDPRGEPLRVNPRLMSLYSSEDRDRLSMFPEDVVAVARDRGCESIAYTYSEPTVWFEYMVDTAKAAREEVIHPSQKRIKNVWVTCGYIQEEPLVELCQWIDAANVDLKSYDEDIYKQLNSGKLEPILSTLQTLRDHGVWFEVTNLIVPTYTDKPGMIRRMCEWMVENLGPDYPLHFSRFHPEHKLTHLEPTPLTFLREAREIAREAGLHYVYVGNCEGIEDAGTTFCPKCHRAVITRKFYVANTDNLIDGKCRHCDTKIAGMMNAER